MLLNHLFGQFRILLDKRFIDFNKFSNLFFKFRDAANIELFCFSSQVSSSSLPTRLLPDKFRLCLRQILTYHLEYAIIHQKHGDLYLIESKMGILTLSALLNTLKIPVNGYPDSLWGDGLISP